MKTQKITPSQWHQHINAWKQSDCSQSEYCRQHQLRCNQFSYWKKKLEIPLASSQRIKKSRFVNVATPKLSQSNGLSLTTPSGVSLLGIGSENIAVVKELLGALK